GPVDDLSPPAPHPRRTKGGAVTSPVGGKEKLAGLDPGPDLEVTVPGGGPIRLHAAVHRLGDTRHHLMRYRFRAATRFREYFDLETLAPPVPATPPGPRDPVDDGQSVVGPE